jgi:hypothetical protein
MAKSPNSNGPWICSNSLRSNTLQRNETFKFIGSFGVLELMAETLDGPLLSFATT